MTQLCESGRIEWAFNLASVDDGRREIRIWSESLSAFQSGIRLPATLEESLDTIIGHSFAEWIPCTRVAQRFCVHRRSIYRWAAADLVLTHELDHTVRVQRASLLAFLRTRRIR